MPNQSSNKHDLREFINLFQINCYFHGKGVDVFLITNLTAYFETRTGLGLGPGLGLEENPDSRKTRTRTRKESGLVFNKTRT